MEVKNGYIRDDDSHDDILKEADDKLIEAKTFLSKARSTKINIVDIKDKVRNSVKMKNQENFKESIRYSEEAIEQADTILDLYEKIKIGKKKIIALKKNEKRYKDMIKKLKQIKKLADEGIYQEANEGFDELVSSLDKRLNEEEDEGDIKDQIIPMIPEDGITIYSLNKKIEKIDEKELEKILEKLEKDGSVKLENKGRWVIVKKTDKGTDKSEENPSKEEVIEGSSEEDIKEKEEAEMDILNNIPLEKEEYNILINIWEDIYLDNMSQEAIELLGWEDKDVFFKDVLFYSLTMIKTNPKRLIEKKILSEFDYLKSEEAEDIIKNEFENQLERFDR